MWSARQGYGRAKSLWTCTALHSPPRAVGIFFSLRAVAIWRNDVAPSALIAPMTGIRSLARLLACPARTLALATLPLLATVCTFHRLLSFFQLWKPSCVPLALAAANATLVRSDIAFASYSAM